MGCSRPDRARGCGRLARPLQVTPSVVSAHPPVPVVAGRPPSPQTTWGLFCPQERCGAFCPEHIPPESSRRVSRWWCVSPACF